MATIDALKHRELVLIAKSKRDEASAGEKLREQRINSFVVTMNHLKI